MSPYLAWQSCVAGPLQSLAGMMQRSEIERRGVRLPAEAVFVIGYWRSGTTLLHELLALDPRSCAPPTQACMNPHSFLLAKGASGRVMQRPMDAMVIRADSPQEDEFALLSLGARSPYEALLAPHALEEALALADPASLSPGERSDWERLFRRFLTAVCAAAPGRVPLLKSPPHACRIAALLSVFPEAKFVLVTRDPMQVFESSVRMWMALFELYSLEALPHPDAVRRAVLATRPGFERAMQKGLALLPPDRLSALRFEDLIADPAAAVERIYAGLDLGAPPLDCIRQELLSRSGYRPAGALPDAAWRSRIEREWSGVLENHARGYAPASQS